MAHTTENISRGSSCGEQARLGPQLHDDTRDPSFLSLQPLFPQSWVYSQVVHSEPYSSKLITVVVKMTVVPGVTTSLSTTPRGKKKASLSQEAQLTSYSDLLLLIKLSPIPEPHTVSNAGSRTWERGTVKLPERKSKSFGQEKQEVGITYPQCWLGRS